MSGKDARMSGTDRHNRLIKERIHDPYMTRSKPAEPAVCMECGVVFNDGRWQWMSEVPQGAHEELCPACQRIRDKVPAGLLELSGDFFQEHRDEIMHLVHNTVESQKREHPMKRLMETEEQEDGTVLVSFTDTHLPSGVGEAVEHAYQGDLDIHYTEEAGIVRVYWRR
jgi:NMD protein affecting ribosome stability and mRNA decay